MIATLEHHGQPYRIDLSRPIDLSLPLHAGEGQMRAWGVDLVRISPVVRGERTFSVERGSSVNFRDVGFNPHGHGTHTECVGHIDPEVTPVGGMLDRYFFIADVVSVRPEERRAPDGRTDQVITLEQLRNTLDEHPPEALVIRTLPNEDEKRSRDWTDSNPPYLQSTATAWLRSIGVRHLLVDLPSVDREDDGGVLAAHHAFWDFPATQDRLRTITELIYVPDAVADGRYLLDLQLPHLMNDAAPSRPVLYAPLP
ncbi:MAG: cyclase family protein [Flavobacteriales bacterium]|nr:cyclase family protein [Flavobacteriales bacterium]MCB9166922.1 cyclase family protein [Flavobacteriales bacterium]